MLLLPAFALAVLIHRRRESRYALLLFAAGGIILSVPFVPPNDADLMRAYAASLPILGLILGIGVGAIANRFRPHAVETAADPGGPGLVAGALVLVLLSVGAAGLAARRSRPPAADPASCPAPETTVSALLSPGSYLLVTGDDEAPTRLPRVRRRDLLAGFEKLGYPQIAAELSGVPAGGMIVNTFDLRSGLPLWLEFTRANLPPRTEVVSFCGQPTSNSSIRFYGFFRANREVGRTTGNTR